MAVITRYHKNSNYNSESTDGSVSIWFSLMFSRWFSLVCSRWFSWMCFRWFSWMCSRWFGLVCSRLFSFQMVKFDVFPWFSLMCSRWFSIADGSAGCISEAIQDRWHYVKVEDWPKLSRVQFWLQVYVDSTSYKCHFYDFWQWPKSKMADTMLKLKIDPNLVGLDFGCKSLCWSHELILSFLWFLVMAAIQDGQQDDIS